MAFENPSTKIKSLNIWGSLALELPLAVAAALILYTLGPSIIRKTGVPFLYLYLPWWISFMVLYFAAALVAYRLEGNPLTLAHFTQRYRLKKITGKDWLWLGALLISFVIVAVGLSLLGKTLSSLPGLSMPSSFPAELNPSHPKGMVAGEFMGVTLKGKWWIAIVYFVGWVFNIFGEEFWFRGYILPRQEVAYGRWAWITHALMWTLHHSWQLWSLVILFPYAFLWSFIIQKGKNTWIPIIVHGAGNLIPLIMIIMGVVG